jgi:uncharacterized delta-60 repeat protein
MRYILLFLTVMVLFAFGQTWLSRYNGPANDEDIAWNMTIDDSGYVLVTGSSWGSGTSYDYLTIMYSPYGESLWVARYDGSAHGSDEARAIVTNSNRVIVTGGSAGSNLWTDILTISYNTDGGEQWTSLYNGPSDGNDFGLAITKDNIGNIYVTGYESGIGTGWDLATVKYNSSGVQQWVGKYSTSDEDYAIGIVASESDIYVTGNSGNPYTFTWDYVTIRYNATTGDTVWTRRYNGPANEHDEVRAIALDSDGNICVTGGSANIGSGADFTTIKYSPDGESLWVRRYNGTANGADWANAIAVDSDNNVYVTGYSQDPTNDYDFVTVKYDADGNQQWVVRYDGPVHSYDEGKAITVDYAGNVYVTGFSTGSGTRSDYTTIKYDASGNEEWVHHYDGPASRQDEAVAIALDQTGGVCITGSSIGNGTGNDYATLRYLVVGIEEEPNKNQDEQDAIIYIHSNPFSNSTTISYQLFTQSYVNLTLHDITGRTITSLATGEKKPGTYNVQFSAMKYNLPKGIYFIHLEVKTNETLLKNQNIVEKLILTN